MLISYSNHTTESSLKIMQRDCACDYARDCARDSNKCFLHPRHVVTLNRCVGGRRALGVAKSTMFTSFTGKVYVRK